MLRGITVTLETKSPGEPDAFGKTTYTTGSVQVDDVLVGEPTSEEIVNQTNLYGKYARFILGIPKGDTHDWENKKVSFTLGGRAYEVQTFGKPIAGIEAMIPLRWNMKVYAATYE